MYHLLATDLRRPPSETLEPLLLDPTRPVLSPNLPTLLLFECVLVYMSPESSNMILKWFTDFFSSPAAEESRSVLGCIIYEMFALQDAFGKVMVKNLRVCAFRMCAETRSVDTSCKARNVSLPGAEPYPTLESLPSRLTQHGWQLARALTLKDIRREFIAPAELERYVPCCLCCAHTV